MLSDLTPGSRVQHAISCASCSSGETRRSTLYTELEPPRIHPAGLNSSAETAKFNAVESSRAVDIAMAMLELAAAPPNQHGRWVTRWVAEREPYHTTVIAPLRERRASGRPTQVQTTDTD
jgi:hypothetical protein